MKVLTFGELLLRLSAPGYTRLLQKDSFEATFCGGEANVAVSLALLGVDAAFLTKLPDNDIGHAAVRALSYFGVDTSRVFFGNGRMGLYYLEKGASQRSSKVIYDRAYSAIALAAQSEFDWDVVFEGVSWFHWTGITPALSDELASICRHACEVAKKKGITVSCDLNYRKKLWSPEKARSIMPELMRYVDVCIANEEDAAMVLGIHPDDSDVENGRLNRSGYGQMAREICSTYGCRYVAVTLRESFSASYNGWSAMLYESSGTGAHFSRRYDIQIVDRVGGGDSFAAGIIYALLQKLPPEKVVEFAAAASCLKHSIEGDFNRVTVQEVLHLMHSGGNGRVQR